MDIPTREPAPSRTNVATLANLAAARGLDTYAVIIEGDGLRPRVFSGSLLTVSTTREPLPGDIVLAQVKGETRAMFLNADGDLLDMRRSWVPFDGGRGYELLGTVVDILPPPME